MNYKLRQSLKLISLLAPLFYTNLIYADDKLDQSNTNIASLPLTALQINKLNKLLHVSHGKNETPTFSIEQPHEHVTWNQTPIDIVLPAGVERMVSFQGGVEFGYDKSILTDGVLKVQNNAGVLYLTAKKEFQTERVEVRNIDTGKIILINLSAKNEASHTPVDIVFSEKDKIIISKAFSVNDNKKSYDSNEIQPSESTVSPVALIRFAAQQLYAPKRLLTQKEAIYRVPMHVPKTLPLFRDNSVMAMSLASWRSGDLFVTAILLRNLLNQQRILDPRELCGNWQAATFFPQTELASKGNSQDSTTLFVISHRPLSESLYGCLAA